MSDELTILRTQIDEVDERLIALLGERFKLTRMVGIYKRDNDVPSQSHSREASQMERIAKLAQQNGVDPDFAQRLLRLTIDEVIKDHTALRAEKDAS